MPTVLAIAIAEVATWVASLATTYVVGLPLSFAITAAISIGTTSRYGVYVSQGIGYGAARFVDLLIGYVFLRLWDATDYVPLLIIPVAWSTIAYARRRFSFDTHEAHVHNRWQKVMNIVGSTAAAVGFLFAATRW